MNIVFFETTNEEKEILSKAFAGFSVTCTDKKLTAETIDVALGADIVSVFVNSAVSKEVIDGISSLKHISTRSTGYDHIDSVYAKTKNISVSTVPSYGSETVAEFAFSLLLNLSRKTSDAVRQIREEGSFDISHFRGFDLAGKTIGVLGTGRIGKHVITIAQGFGMKVVAFDAFPNEAYATEQKFTYASLHDVLAQSDVVTIHTPYNKDTFHLLNKESITSMKKGSYLINTARGEIVDTEALIWGLQEGIIAGAALDVLEGERPLKEEAEFLFAKSTSDVSKEQEFKILLEDHMLMKMPQVLITPHIAFSSVEAENEILKTTIDNIESFIHNTPKNTI